MSYILEHKDEAIRLEKQVNMPQYSIETELKYLTSKDPQNILDAGCGTGIAARCLKKKYPNAKITGADFSEIRLQQAKEYCRGQEIHFQTIDLLQTFATNEYDLICCRYVLEHLDQPQRTIQNFYTALQKNGHAFIVDFDGIFFNLVTANKKLNFYLKKIVSNLKMDPYIGSKIPSMLKLAGFKDISYDIVSITFKGKDLELEHQNNMQRCQQCFQTFSQILGGDNHAQEFCELYLEESLDTANVLYYNKFMISASK